MKRLALMAAFAASMCAAAAESPRVLAHRGGRAEYDDNAAGGFVKCLEAGVTGFETDVRMTKDLQLVIMHDATVERTAEGTGVVEEMAFDAVTNLVMRRSREKVPGAGRLMDAFKGRTGLDIELEMKAGGKFYQGENLETYCRRLHDMAAEKLAPGTYTFTSFHTNALATMKRLFPDAPTGYIRSEVLTKEFVDTAKSLGCRRVAPAIKDGKGRFTEKEVVDYAHACGMTVTCWMVQGLDTWKKAKSAGCDCTTSDHPVALLKAIREQDEAAPLRVGSYNIRLSVGDNGTPNAWPGRKDDLVALIRRLDLDAFGLQEVRPDQAEFLDKSFPDYAKYGEHRGADRKSDEASSIYFRTNRFECVKGGTFWLSETPDTPGLKGWGAACPRVCSWALLKDRRTGKQFCFANTHTDHVSALARKEGMLLIIRRMEEFAPHGTPIVFTGDHNCREIDEPAQAVAKKLKNALYVSETPPEGPWRTFNGWRWRDSEYPAAEAMKLTPDVRNGRKAAADKAQPDCGPRIDYIYVSPGVKVRRCATHPDPRPGKKLYPSDHFPVTAEIEL